MTSNNGGNRGGNSERGFAAMDPERQREIASEGGRAAHENGNAHEFTSEEAREAGRKGGEAVSQDVSTWPRLARRAAKPLVATRGATLEAVRGATAAVATASVVAAVSNMPKPVVKATRTTESALPIRGLAASPAVGVAPSSAP